MFGRKTFAVLLARNTPLVLREAKEISRRIKYDADAAMEIVAGDIEPWEPRDTFYPRLVDALKSR